MATKTKLSVRPMGDRVIIAALPQEEKTKGGIILPDTAKEKPQQDACKEAKGEDSGLELLPTTPQPAAKELKMKGGKECR